MNSPPKRLTRARAAAKASEVAVKTTKVHTAATTTRSTSTATSSTKSATAKRKTRADEIDGDVDLDNSDAMRTTRARSRFIAGSQDIKRTQQKVLSPKAARKRAAIELSNKGSSASTRPRGRPRMTPASQANSAVQQTKEKATRERTTLGSQTLPGSRIATTKKRVKFQEPGKENLDPEENPKDLNGANSLCGRPARRGNKTKPELSSEDCESPPVKDCKKPLSPRKMTQMPCGREMESPDNEESKSGERLLLRSPKKSLLKVQDAAGTAKDLRHVAEMEDESITMDAAKLGPAPDSASIGSPPRKPPASPPKDSLKSPAKKMGAVLLPGSVLRPVNSLLVDHKDQQSAKTPSLLQSPAKRPPSPIKSLGLASPTGKHTLSSTTLMKNIMFRSPAKRAMPRIEMPIDQPRENDRLFAQRQQPNVDFTSTDITMQQISNKLLMAESEGECVVTASPSAGQIEERQVSQQPTAGVSRRPNSIFNIRRMTNEVQPDPTQTPETDVAFSVEDMRLDSYKSASRSSLHQGSAVKQRNDIFGQSELEKSIVLNEKICCVTGLDLATDDNVSALGHPTPPCDTKNSVSIDSSRYARNVRKETASSNAVVSLPELDDAWSAFNQSSLTTDHAAVPGGSPCGELATATSFPDATLGSDLSSMEGAPIKKKDYNLTDVSKLVACAPPAVDQIDEDSLTIENMILADEDVALAEEANHLSILPQHQPDEVDDVTLEFELLSETSQEFGDENQAPMDHTLMNRKYASLSTPDRPPPLQYFCTTTKVPLKPADDSESSPSRQGSFSAPRTCPAVSRELRRSDTVLSTPCSKSEKRGFNLAGDDLFSTPLGKSAGKTPETPGRTPRKDINPELLRGAVIFVDVYTSDGADASGLFVELLTHMGAKCVKTWHWNPQSPSAGDIPSGKIGITHVVYKDGGKRTMEKLQETNGIVHCVGVGWVLDCERENEWLDESPYSVDIIHTPRRGCRRRKSMEPDAIENLNGAIISSSCKSTRTPKTPRNRRESTLWMVSPVDRVDQDEDDDLEWSCAPLTPVPKTPAPEAVAQYAADLPETPYTSDGSEATSSARQGIITKTCSSKTSKYRDLGDAVLAVEKNEQVMLRLMAARRKSLQFAPKVGSPLAKAWQ